MRSPRKKAAANAQAASLAKNLPPGLAKPALRALFAAGIRTRDVLRTLDETELAGLHGIGPRALALLNEARRD